MQSPRSVPDTQCPGDGLSQWGSSPQLGPPGCRGPGWGVAVAPQEGAAIRDVPWDVPHPVPSRLDGGEHAGETRVLVLTLSPV